MRKASLIVNPSAGRLRCRTEIVQALVETLAGHNIAADMVETSGPGTAGQMATSAAAAGSEIVFACGGDGTVHEVIQGLSGTPTALGIIPMGTANALARNLGISRDPLRAAIQLASAETVRIPLGQVINSERCLRFAVMAGAGPDGALVYSLLAAQKSVMGRTAYYAHAARLFLTRSFEPFRVQYRIEGSDIWQEVIAVSAMSARIGNLGGIFGRLTHGCSLHAGSLRLVIVRPPGRVGLASWFVFGQLGISQFNPWLQTLDVEEFRCESLLAGDSIHAQVDGEWIGGLPISASLIPDALSLLAPRAANSADS